MRKVSKDVLDRPIALIDNREVFNRYLEEIRGYKPLTREEELLLFTKLKEGDRSVIDKIVKHNLKFVITCAKHYLDIVATSNITLEDLICEGNYGMLIAIDKFDPKLGFKFISYAVSWIGSSILNYIQNNIRNVRNSSNRQSLLFKLNKLEAELEQKLERNCENSELLNYAQEKGLLNDTQDSLFLSELKSSYIREKSLSASLDISSELSLIDILPNPENISMDDEIENVETNKFINNILNEFLPSGIAKIFIMYYGLNGEEQKTFKEIGDVLDVNYNTIRMRHQNYVHKIKRQFKKDFNLLITK